MATTTGLIQRARLEIGDLPEPFVVQPTGDGNTITFELPSKPVDATTINVVSLNPSYAPSYLIDERNGLITFNSPVPLGTQVNITGKANRYFTDTDWTTFVNTAVSQHLHNRTNVTLASLDSVEEYPLSLLAVTEALYTLLNNAAFDIDISTPEGVGIPRHQRYEQLMNMLTTRLDQYHQLSLALNVGLYRVEMFNLRRKSRTTNKFAPVYVTQEFEDIRFPVRVFPTIDTDGQTPVNSDLPQVSLTMIQGQPYSGSITLPLDLTGSNVVVALRKYRGSAALKYFVITVTNATAGQVTFSMAADTTFTLGGGPYWWDLRVVANGFATSYVEGPVTIEERPRT